MLHRHADYGGRGSKTFKERLAKRAEGIVRFEITFIGATKLRELFKLPKGVQPTLRLMADERVGDHFLGKELEKLRLFAVDGLGDAREGASAQNELLRHVCALARKFNDSPLGQNSRRTRMSLSRVYAMLGYYVTSAPNVDVVGWFGQGESTIKDLARDLRAIGLPRVGYPSPDVHRRLELLVDALAEAKPDFPPALPPLPMDSDAKGYTADAPWVGELVDYDGGEGFSVESYGEAELDAAAGAGQVEG